MATDTPAPESAEPVPAPVAPAPPEPAVDPAPKSTPEPVSPAHDPWLVHQAKELSISQDEIAAMTPGELQRSVVLLARQQARIAQELAKPKPTEPAPPPAEPAWELPAEVKSELAEMNPALLKAIELSQKANEERVKKLEGQLGQVRQQSEGQAFGQRVSAEMSKIPALGSGPVREGSPEHAKRAAVLNHLAYLETTGQLNGVPPEVAIPMAFRTLFGEAAPAKPTPPGNLSPTTSARPTNRLREGTEGLSAREALKRLYEEKLQVWDAEEQANSETNGSFRP